jgi:hypothetical protein
LRVDSGRAGETTTAAAHDSAIMSACAEFVYAPKVPYCGISLTR